MEILDEEQTIAPETPAARPVVLLGAAGIVAVGAELALHTWMVNGQPPGLGIPLAVAIIVVGLTRGGASLGYPSSRRAVAFYVSAIGFASLTAIRSASPLVAINLLAAIALLLLAFTAHGSSQALPRFLSGFARAAGRFTATISLGGFGFLARDLHEFGPIPTTRLRRVLTGTLMAVPMLILFGSLFISADEVFADAVGRLFSIRIPDNIGVAIGIAAAIGWLELGALRGIVTPAGLPHQSGDRRSVGATEAATAMWLINSLFLLFVAFQVFEALATYGDPDVSYANQARHGFFQLCWVAAIVIVMVLVLDWAIERTGRPRLHRQQLVLVLLTTAILVSALVRMGLYVDAFGLTRLRVYTTVFMVWIAFLLIWLTRSVLTGRRHRFAQPAIAGLFVMVLALNIINPDAIIASYNLDHRPRLTAGVDEVYLYDALSPDAVPVIISNIDRLADACDQLRVLDRLPTHRSQDLRSWNLARSRADGLVANLRQQLDASCQSG